MKRLIVFLMVLFFSQLSFSQSCLPEGIIFTTQGQIDSFHVNYPGCTIIEGDVSFVPNIVTSLYGLSGLTAVNGNFKIKATMLLNLSGLNSLTKVGGSLIFHHNDRLRSLTALQNLDSIGGTFELYYSDTLSSLTGLENLTYVGDSLWIDHLDSIVDLSGLENLSYVGNLIVIVDNEKLVSLEGLNGLGSIVSIYIHDNDVLIDVSALGNLDTIPYYLSFGHNDILPNLAGLNSIKSINGGLRVTNNDAMVNLEGLDSLAYAGFLLIGSTDVGGNESLTSLSGLDNLKHIQRDLIISQNPMLEDLGALIGLDSIGGYIEIINNSALTSLSGLDNISAKSITDLTITNNDQLSGCAVESICNYLVASNGTVDIHDNDTGCNSREEVEEACGPIYIVEKPGLLNCSIFPNPTNGISHFTFRISRHQYVSLKIYDVYGKEILTVLDEMKPAAEHTVMFDASALSPGIYFCRFTANNQTASEKLIMIR